MSLWENFIYLFILYIKAVIEMYMISFINYFYLDQGERHRMVCEILRSLVQALVINSFIHCNSLHLIDAEPAFIVF